jgi:hypothetical protein
MVKSPKDIFVGIVLITTVLLAVTSHLWLNKVQTVVALFDDTTAIVLLGLVVLLLAWYDCKMGIAFAILVGMVAITVKTAGFTQFMESFVDNPPFFSGNASQKGGLEFNVNGTRTAGGSFTDISPVTEGFANPDSFGLEPENGAQIIQDKMTAQMKVTRPCDKDFLTYTRGTDYHGYDVAGCRYDSKDGNQNGTIYGPPLSWCATYKDNTHAVPFYPLNG